MAMHTVDTDTFSYVADKAAMVHLTSADPTYKSYDTLRIFALPKISASPAGVPGHYLYDATEELEMPTFPCVVKLADDGIADKLGLFARPTQSGKLYIMTVELPLQIQAAAGGKPAEWVNDKKLLPVKIDTIKAFQLIENRDGCSLGVQADAWLKGHSNFGKVLKAPSLLAWRSLYSAGKYEQNVSAAFSNLELALRKDVKQASGGKAKKAAAPTVAEQQAKDAELKVVEEKVAEARKERDVWLSQKEFYMKPLGERLIEATLDPDMAGKPLSADSISSLIDSATLDRVRPLVDLAKLVDKLQLINDGTVSINFTTSPMKSTSGEPAEAEAQGDKPTNPKPLSKPFDERMQEQEGQGQHEHESDSENHSGSEEGEVQEMPSFPDTVRRSSTRASRKPDFHSPPTAESKSNSSKGGKRAVDDESSEKPPEKKTKGPKGRVGRGPNGTKMDYSMSGRYSRDPAYQLKKLLEETESGNAGASARARLTSHTLVTPHQLAVLLLSDAMHCWQARTMRRSAR